MRILNASLLSIAILLTGCAQGMNQTVLGPLPPDKATIKLAEAASSATHSLSELEAIEKTRTPKYRKHLPNPTTPGMTDMVSIDWSGPIRPLLEHIAKASHYKFHVLGRGPAIPVIVSMLAKNVPLSDVLRDADYQAGRKAFVFVSPSRRTIELRYAEG